jgi:hypothetical protein
LGAEGLEEDRPEITEPCGSGIENAPDDEENVASDRTPSPFLCAS